MWKLSILYRSRQFSNLFSEKYLLNLLIITFKLDASDVVDSFSCCRFHTKLSLERWWWVDKLNKAKSKKHYLRFNNIATHKLYRSVSWYKMDKFASRWRSQVFEYYLFHESHRFWKVVYGDLIYNFNNHPPAAAENRAQ